MIPYIHTQSSASSTWTVAHNLGHKPVSDVLVDENGSLQKILPASVIHVDDNTLQINFSSARTGVAKLM